MALTKQTITDKVETVKAQDHYVLQVREAIQVLEDGNVISQNYHRYVLNPDADVSTITDPVVKYYGMNFKSPSDLDEYLTCRYGSNWKIPNPKWAWPLHMEAELKSNFINKADIKDSAKNIFE